MALPDKLYELAFAYKKTQLWNKLRDDQLFCVRHKDGELSWCSVCGNNGTTQGLLILNGDEGLRGYLDINAHIDTDHSWLARELSLNQNCIFLSYLSESEIEEDALAEIQRYMKAHNMTARKNNTYPAFQLTEPDCSPSRNFSPKHIAHAIDALEVAISISESLVGYPTSSLGFRSDEPLEYPVPLFTDAKDGYSISEIRVPEFARKAYPVGTLRDDIMLAKLRKARSAGTIWGVRILHGFIEEEDPDSGRVRFPLLLLITDETEKEVLYLEQLDPNDEYADSCVVSLCECVLDYGKPKKIIVTDARTEQCFSQLKEKALLPLVFEDKDDLLDPRIAIWSTFLDDDDDIDFSGDEFTGFDDGELEYEDLDDDDIFSGFFDDDAFADDDFEEMDTMIDNIAAMIFQPYFLKSMSNEELLGLSSLLLNPKLPDSAKDRIRKELRRRNITE